MKRFSITDVIASFFILLFLYTGLLKLMGLEQFREELNSSPLPSSILGMIAWAIPITEILLATALITPRFRLKGLYATLVLMLLFTGYVLFILQIDSHISCSCGGIIEDLSPQMHLLFNSACVILSLLGIVASRKQKNTRRSTWAVTTFSFLMLSVISWVIFTAFTSPATVKTGMEGSPLPAFKLQLQDSVSFINTADIPTGSALVFIGFSPTCTHCQSEAADIVAHIKDFKQAQIYFVTDSPFGQMKTFYNHFKLKDYSNIIIGRDSANIFMKYFKASSVPYITVYDSQKRLKQVMNKQVSSSDIIQAINE